VEVIRASLPELDGVRSDDGPTPARRATGRAALVRGGELAEAPLEHIGPGDHLILAGDVAARFASRGRVAKKAPASSSVTGVACPTTRTCRSSADHNTTRATLGSDASSTALALRLSVKNTKPRSSSPRKMTARAEGPPFGDEVASTMATTQRRSL